MVPRYTFFEVIYMINYEHLAKKLKSFRTQRKLSQTTLAELIGLRQKDISHMETCTGNSIDSISKVCLYADACNIPYSLLFENEVNTGLSDFGYNKNDPIMIPSHHQNKGDDGMEREFKIKDPKGELSFAINNAEKAKVFCPPMPHYLTGAKEDNKLLSDNGDLRLSKNLSLNTVDYCGQNVLVLGSCQDNHKFVSQNLRTCDGNYIVAATNSYNEEKELLKNNGYDVVDVTFDEEANYNFFKELSGRSDQDVIHDILVISSIIDNTIFDSLKHLLVGYRTPIIKMLFYMYFFSHETDTQISEFVQYVQQTTSSVTAFNQAIKETRKNKRACSADLFADFEENRKRWKHEFLSGGTFVNAGLCGDTDELLNSMLIDIGRGICENCCNVCTSTDKSLREVCTEDKFAIFINYRPVMLPAVEISSNILFSWLLGPLYQRGFADAKVHKYPVIGKGIKILLDDFGNIPLQYCDLDTNFSLSAGIHISFILCMQSVYQLAGRYEYGADKIFIANAGTIVCSSIMSVQDRKFLQDMCGIKNFDMLQVSTTCLVHTYKDVCIIDKKL